MQYDFTLKNFPFKNIPAVFAVATEGALITGYRERGLSEGLL